MTCKEFNEKIADLFDVNVNAQDKAEFERHMEQCSECRTAYEELCAVYAMLQPSAKTQHELDEISTNVTFAKSPTKKRKIWWAVAASVIFLLGVFVGLNNFFTSSATAASQNSIALFDKAITYVQNVGSFQMEVFVRTNPEENFFDIHPDKDFIKSRVQLMRQADTVLYRIEREVEHGRVIVCDGKAQYMFVKNGTRYVKGNLGSDFLGMYGNLLYPDRLLQMQKSAIELAGDNTVLRSETDSTIVVVVEGTEWDDNLQEIYATGHRGRNHVTIENMFSKPDGLLRSVKYWLHKDGNKILVLYTGAIQYNPALSRKAITALPDEYSHPATEGGVYDMTNVSEMEDEELAQLQKESPVQTAARLLAAFTSGRAEDVKENLAGYVGNIDKINKRMKGCKFRELRELKVEDYVGVYIVYTLEYPDGATSQMHLALRNDNPWHVWLLDGGL